MSKTKIKKTKEKSYKTYFIITFVFAIIMIFLFLYQYGNVLLYKEELNKLGSDYEDVKSKFEDYKFGTDNLLSSALIPPYIAINNQKVYSVFRRSDGKIVEWVTPFKNLNYDLQKGYFKREYVDEKMIPLQVTYSDAIVDFATECYNSQIRICNLYQSYVNYYTGDDIGCLELKESLQTSRDNMNTLFMDSLLVLQKEGKEYIELDNVGKNFNVMDFTPFVDESNFRTIIPEMYYEINNDEKFIHELWYIISQLTTYSFDIKETPKYPLETLLSGGGDCEDTAILLASMLKAVPKNWKISLVYMDADNPTNPKDINHVIVHINTGKETYFIESTSKDEMNPYDKVVGWYFEV